MATKHFDISFLEDAKAFANRELGKDIIEFIVSYLDQNQTIIVERRPTNSEPVILHVLTKKNSGSEKFIEHWKNIFDNM